MPLTRQRGRNFGGITENGYIKLWRKFRETSFYRDSHCVHLAVHLLLECNHKPLKVLIGGKEITIERGQMLTNRAEISEFTGISEQCIRTSLQHLETTHFLTRESTNKGTIISIVKYEEYQENTTKELTSNQPATNQQLTSLSYKKNGRMEEVYNNICADRPTRFNKPTVEEVSAYCKERNNSVNANAFVDFYESKGWRIGNSPMKSWKAAVRTWERSSHKTASNGNVGANNAILTDLEREVLLMYKRGKGIEGADDVYIAHNAGANKKHLASIVAALETIDAIKAHFIAYDAALSAKGYKWTLQGAAKAAWEAKTQC